MVNELTLARKARNLSQQELSRLTGVPRICISRYETGRFRPSYDNAKKLSVFFGRTIEDLFDKKAG